MADFLSGFSPLSQSVGSFLRKRSEQVRDALAPPQTPPPALPRLQGKALAKQHLNLALAALHEEGTSKTERFRKLRLLINTMEQGPVLSAPQADPAVIRKTPTAPITPIRRRDRLVRLALPQTMRNRDQRHDIAS